MHTILNNLFQRIQIFTVFAAWITLHSLPASADTLAGVVVSPDDRPVSGALVTVTDNATGMALIETSNRFQGPHFTSTVTDSAGSFTLRVPPGNYNVLAQHWTKASVDWESTGLFGGQDHFGESVVAAGTAAQVSVPSPHGENLRISPAGSGSVDVQFESGNNDSIVVISAAPPLDPIFGLSGWIGDFATSAIAFNRAPQGKTQFHNVPPGMLYVAVFGNDSRPSYGAASVAAANGTTTSIKVEWIGPWTNARQTPPERLQPLYEKVVANGWNTKNFPEVPVAALSRNRPNLQAFKKLVEQGDQVVSLPDGSKESLLDVATVVAYQMLAADVENHAKMTRERNQ